MSQTPEQEEADVALRAAVEQSRRAYGQEDRNALVTDFIVLFAEQGFDDDGHSFTAYAYLTGNAMPLYRAIGLIDVVGSAIRSGE